MVVSIKITQGSKIRTITSFPSPFTFPLRFGQEKDDHVFLSNIPAFRLECEEDKIFLLPSSSVYRMEGLVETKIGSEIKILVRDHDTFRIENVTFEFAIDANKGDILCQNPAMKAVLEQKYGKLWLVGYGGIASVYTEEKQEKAVKILARGYTDPKIVQRFEMSSEKVKTLDHLGLLKVGNTFSHPEYNLYYAEMEYCPGITLVEMIGRKERLQQAQCFSLIRQLAEVLNYLASQSIIHRDVHPKNILVDDAFCLKLLGLMLVKSSDSDLTQKGATMFTPNFSSPEQVEDPSTVDYKTDAFSMGAVAYYILAGEPPFGARNHSEYVKMMNSQEPPVPLNTYNKTVPDDIADLIHRSMTFDCQKRPSIEEFLDEYRNILRAIQARSEASPTAQKIRESGQPILTEFIETRELRQLGQFQITKEIGQGGLGRVYKAYDTKLDRVVAIKLLRRGAFANEDDLQRFQEEARVVGQLEHPNISRLYEVSSYKNQPFLVMEFIEGKPLAGWAKDASIQEIVKKIKEIAEILEYAHGRHIIHRDIKPSNIIVRNDNQPVLLDFGMARDVQREDRLTKTGSFVGTLAYASPEQIRQEPPTPAMDVYSLGILFYELLTRQLPFTDDPTQLLPQIMKETLPEPVSPRTVNPEIPCDLETICLHAMSLKTQNRYASPKELAEDIDRFLKGEIIQARPAGSFYKFLHWTQKRWHYMIPAVLMALVLIVSVILALRYQRQNREKTIQAHLEHGLDLASSFPGETPTKTYREARRFLESARSFAPRDEQVQEALAKLYLQYGEWALNQGQSELAEDALASLKTISSASTWQKFEDKLTRFIYLESQRKCLLDWEQDVVVRIQAAKILEKDTSPKTWEAFEKAKNDPEEMVRLSVLEILQRRNPERYPKDELEIKPGIASSQDHIARREEIYSLKQLIPSLSSDFPVVPLIIAVLNDPENEPQDIVIQQSLEILFSREEQTARDLKSLLENSEDTDIRLQAIHLASLCKNRYIATNIIPALIELLNHKNSQIAKASAQALGQIGEHDLRKLIALVEMQKNSDMVTTIFVQIGTIALPELMPLVTSPVSSIRDHSCTIVQKMGAKSIPFLLRYLESSNMGIRYKTTQIIQSMGTDTLPMLLECLAQNQNPEVQSRIVGIIGTMGKSAISAEKRLSGFVSSSNAELRYSTLQALLSISGQDVLMPLLIDKISDSDIKVQRLAIASLGNFGSKASSAIPQLTKIVTKNVNLEDSDLVVDTVITLGKIGQSAKNVLPSLKELFIKAEWKTRYAIACASLQIEKPEATELHEIVSGLPMGNPDRRYQSIRKLESWPEDGLLFWLTGLKDPSDNVCIASIEMLGKYHKTQQVLDGLIQTLSHHSSQVREKAFQSVSGFGLSAERAAPLFIQAFEDPSDAVRIASIRNVLKIARLTPLILVSLIKALENASPDVRQTVVSVVASLQEIPAQWIGDVEPLLHHGSPHVRMQTIVFLGTMGAKASPVTGGMLQLLPQADMETRQALQNSLQKIGVLPLAEAKKGLAHSSYLVKMETVRLIAERKQDTEHLWENIPALWAQILALFQDADPQIVSYAKKALDTIKTPSDDNIPAVQSAVQSSIYEERLYGLKAVAGLGEKAGVDVDILVPLLKDQNGEIREEAASALASIGKKSVPPAIAMLKNEPSDIIANRASKILGKIEPRVVLPFLIQEIKNMDANDPSTKQYRDRIGITIGFIGQPAVPAMLEIFEGNDDTERHKAARMLVYLGQNAIAPMTKCLSNSRWQVRRYAAWTLAGIAYLIGEDARKKNKTLDEDIVGVVAGFRQALKDTKPEVRLEVIKAYRKFVPYLSKPQVLADDLMSLLETSAKKSELDAVREASAQTLSNIWSAIPGNPMASQIEARLKQAGFWPPKKEE